MKLEVIVLPVSDPDAAKEFYEKAGFHLDVDHQAGDSFRVIQLTPPGSACSITFGVGLGRVTAAPVQGLHLVVTDMEAAIAGLAERGIEVSPPFHFGPDGQSPGLHPERSDFGSYSSFMDPSGNGWLLQEVGWSPQE
jgi:catechol 2,3-dioxygenase-like lactoylglutathione lyase family enzyme